MKPVRLSNHAQIQMLLRRASRDEVEVAIKSGKWEKAKLGRFIARYRFEFNSNSPINQKFYKYKIVEPIFVEETDVIIVITVKVYYSNREEM